MAARHSRKLPVILHADVVGSTDLVQRDETLAHERIQTVFRRLSTTNENFGGTTHELRGDALVAEFDRASDAVSAAIAFQAGNSDFNASLDDDIRPQLRIGIAMGDVVFAERVSRFASTPSSSTQRSVGTYGRNATTVHWRTCLPISPGEEAILAGLQGDAGRQYPHSFSRVIRPTLFRSTTRVARRLRSRHFVMSKIGVIVAFSNYEIFCPQEIFASDQKVDVAALPQI